MLDKDVGSYLGDEHVEGGDPLQVNGIVVIVSPVGARTVQRQGQVEESSEKIENSLKTTAVQCKGKYKKKKNAQSLLRTLTSAGFLEIE